MESSQTIIELDQQAGVARYQQNAELSAKRIAFGLDAERAKELVLKRRAELDAKANVFRLDARERTTKKTFDIRV